ncbi:hypothetical protein ASD11_14360 [Aeromicrobium sp. Root495]|uniref:MlaD family protein n=1 Tax=Aeromicrobium sp. Root495 TaxID=1736550 RepID=UPI0006FE699E|nr:MlaD family protein [Aeromicrobium sp. Root495]KQY55694.1 hypothetical protein ASD11_14360 [Aeromicrobium sp. Root495]
MNAERLGGGRGLAVIAICALMISVGLVGALASDGDGDAIYYAKLKDASPLIEGNDVKISGVRVGTIDSIEVDGGVAKVGMKLDPAGLPLHDDAKATVRPVSLLGERFLELDRGSAEAPALTAGGTIPTSRTGNATDLDQVLNVLDEPTAQSLAAFVTTMGEGLDGNGKNADAAIKTMQPAMQDTQRLAALLDDQSDVLTSLIDSIQPLSSALAADEGKRLDSLVSTAEKLLSTTSSKEGELDQTLARLPDTLAVARKTLKLLHSTADGATPTLKGLRPTTDELTAISDELTSFLEVADPALQSADPLLQRADDLLGEARPVVASLRKSAPGLSKTLDGARPVGRALLDNLTNVLDFVRFWALTTNGEDGLSNYFRSHAVVTAEPVTGLIPGLGDLAGGTEQAGGAADPDGPGSSTDLPDLAGVPLLGDVLDGLLGSSSKPTVRPTKTPSPTGLTEKQESSLIDQLMGALG